MSARGRLICFTGIDGSGKTTQAMLLAEWLQQNGFPSAYIWNRGGMGLNQALVFLGRRAMRTSDQAAQRGGEAYREYQSRKDRLFRNPLVRGTWYLSMRLGHLARIYTAVLPPVLAGKVVVSDRYLWDSSVDLAITLGQPPEWLANRLNRLVDRLAPRPDRAFFIDLPAEEAYRRKDDIPSFEYVQKRVGYYRSLARSQGLQVLDGCEEAAGIHRAIVQSVQACLDR